MGRTVKLRSMTTTIVLGAASLVGVGAACAPPAWPAPAARAMGEPTESGPQAPLGAPGGGPPAICIGTLGWSAGRLGQAALFRERRRGDTWSIGYFVHWSTERPWGQNWLTYTVLPALLVDAVYTHFLFVLPGLQRAIFGPGDVEGVRVDLRQLDDGVWAPVGATADDGAHHEIALTPEDFVDADGRLVFLTDVWSHQLSARGGRRFAREHGERLTCYAGGALLPLDDETTRAFRLGSENNPRRAPPAWSAPGESMRM
jgi:hypothetical protein